MFASEDTTPAAESAWKFRVTDPPALLNYCAVPHKD